MALPIRSAESHTLPGVQPLVDNINRVFAGKPDVVLRAVVTLIARGHLLIEDVPGIGKTLLGVALARSIKATFRRIQFTNDLLPSDILGLSIYSQRENRFEFKPGPIFSHVVLVDEINRATPKTQSALLEAMNELQVTIDGMTHPLPAPFLVIATQNPVEYHGTFPLPEAQLDRFLMRLTIGYPDSDDEKKILRENGFVDQMQNFSSVLGISDVVLLQNAVDQIRIDDELLDYVVRIAEATRSAKSIKLGLSPRGALALCRSAKAFALVSGRDYCVPDDLKWAAVPVISHRILLDSNAYGMSRIAESEAAVENLLKTVPTP